MILLPTTPRLAIAVEMLLVLAPPAAEFESSMRDEGLLREREEAAVAVLDVLGFWWGDWVLKVWDRELEVMMFPSRVLLVLLPDPPTGNRALLLLLPLPPPPTVMTAPELEPQLGILVLLLVLPFFTGDCGREKGERLWEVLWGEDSYAGGNVLVGK